jgi:hypothetical protein
MSRATGTDTHPTASARRGRKPAAIARLAALAALLCLALSAAPAMAATAAPTLIAPTASSAHNSPLSVEYTLPEAGANATLSFIPSVGSPIVVTLSSPAAAAGKHHFFLDLHQLASETANVTEASATSLPDGEYKVTLSYQNLALDPAASVIAEKVTIKTATATPAVLEPTAGQTFRKPFTVTYTLPEAALPGSVKLLLFGSKVGPKQFVLSSSSAGLHSAEIVPSNPSTGIGIASASTERLPTDSYQLSVSYLDTLGNPVASTVPIAVDVGYPFCEAGTYSASGEQPCTDAPRGYFVAAERALVAEECALGKYAPEEGLVECLPASPGHYVPATGAKAQMECEQGTYSAEVGRSSCLSAPFGHYAPKGAVTPTACPAGRFDAHTNSPSAEFCEFDSPGWYSDEGAAEPIPCVPGKYAFAYGSEACLPAPPGSYVPSIGATDPTPCPAGTYTPVTSSVICTSTPANTYATGGASEATPCPSGTQSPAGASACTAVGKEAAAGGSGGTSTNSNSTASTTTTTTAAATPSPISLSPAGPAAKFAIAAAKHGSSLAGTRRQRYAIACSTAATVYVRAAAIVQAGAHHMALTARTSTLACKTAKPAEAAASFTLTSAAKKLLREHGASVKLTVRVYATATAKSAALASATLRGRP